MTRFSVHLAMGDPQAPFTTVLEVLDRARALSRGGTLASHVQLVSMGDHFDWGPTSARARATRDAVALVSWLASHSPEQVVLLVGNHDLSRVSELAAFADDDAYQQARTMADRAYRRGDLDVEAHARFLEAYPDFPDAETLARDDATYSTEQRRLVELLLREGRFRLAHAHEGLLLVHAGVTEADLAAVGAGHGSAQEAAAGLNAFLDARVAAWGAGPLDLSPLHQPGSSSRGPARGALVHRPADPTHCPAADFGAPPRRRFDPRELPSAFPQAIGHIRDDKCRQLMPAWCDDEQAGDGPLRSLLVEGEAPRYVTGCAPGARLLFLDGGMAHAPVERYELLDLDARDVFRVSGPRSG